MRRSVFVVALSFVLLSSFAQAETNPRFWIPGVALMAAGALGMIVAGAVAGASLESYCDPNSQFTERYQEPYTCSQQYCYYDAYYRINICNSYPATCYRTMCRNPSTGATSSALIRTTPNYWPSIYSVIGTAGLFVLGIPFLITGLAWGTCHASATAATTSSV